MPNWLLTTMRPPWASTMAFTIANPIPVPHMIVIYCTCPNQASSSRALQLLRGYGLAQLRMLAGGLQAWRASGFEIQRFEFDSSVVFTVPHELNVLALENPHLFYDLLFTASTQTLLEIASDPKHLGAEIGVIAILHT